MRQNQCQCWVLDLFPGPHLKNGIVYKLTFDTIITLTLSKQEGKTLIPLDVSMILL